MVNLRHRLTVIRALGRTLGLLAVTIVVIVAGLSAALAGPGVAGEAEIFRASFLEVYLGRRVAGSVRSLQASDDVSLDVSSTYRRSSRRYVTDIGLYVDVPPGSTPETIEVDYELDTALTHQILFWDWGEETWAYLPKIKVPADVPYYAQVLNDREYISDEGTIVVSFTATRKRAFTYALDELSILLDGEAVPTPTPTPTPSASDPGWSPAPQPQPVAGTTIRDLGVATSRCGEGGSLNGLQLTATAPRSAGWLIVGEVARLDLYAPPGSGGTIGWYLYDPSGGTLTVNGCSATYQAGTGGTFYQTSAEIVLYVEGSQSTTASGKRSASRRLTAPAPPCSHLGCGTAPTPTPTPTPPTGGGEGGPSFGRTRAAYQKFLIYNPDNAPASLCDNEYLQVALPDFDDFFFLDTPWGILFGPFFKAATFQPIPVGVYEVAINYADRPDEVVEARVTRCGYARVIRG